VNVGVDWASEKRRGVNDRAMKSDNEFTRGGIDLNSANFNLVIKRDGKGIALPISQQDMAQFATIGGFVPKILSIKTVTSLPFLDLKVKN
jgi:hypothetical protein